MDELINGGLILEIACGCYTFCSGKHIGRISGWSDLTYVNLILMKNMIDTNELF